MKPQAHLRIVGADPDSREELIRAGIKLFSQYGMDGTTVRDIAAAAGTNICMVSYHFGGKAGLYRACLEMYGKERAESLKELTRHPKTLDEFELLLRLIVTKIAGSLVQYPEMVRMMLREMEQGLPHAADVYEGTILKVMRDLEEFFRNAQKQGIVREDLCPMMLAISLHGAIGNLFHFEKLTNRYFDHDVRDPVYIRKAIENTVTVFINGIKKGEV